MPYTDLYVGSTWNPNGNKQTTDYINNVFGLSDMFKNAPNDAGQARAPSNVDLTVRGSTRLQDLATGLFGAYAQSQGGQAQEVYQPTQASYGPMGMGDNPTLLVVGVLGLATLVYFVAKKK